ncbi:hypothetical protein PJP10_28925 [Mycobacterium kansasii]
MSNSSIPGLDTSGGHAGTPSHPPTEGLSARRSMPVHQPLRWRR